MGRASGLQFVGPRLCPMQQSQHMDHTIGAAIDGEVRGAPDDQFSGPCETTGATAFRKAQQAVDVVSNAIVHGDRGQRIIRLDVVEDRVSVGKGEAGSFQSHGLFSPTFRKAAARRLAKCASTSSYGTPGRISSKASCTFARNQMS